MIFCSNLYQHSTKALSNSWVTVLLLFPAAIVFKRLSEKAGARHIFYPIYMIFIFYIRKTFGNNREKFQLKRLICLGEMIFYLHAPIKNAVKTGFSLKSTWDTQLCLKSRRTWTVWPKKTSLVSFCREMNALSSGYNTFEKMFCRWRIIDRFCEWSDLSFSILGCPYFGGYYSVLLKVLKICFTEFGTWDVALSDDIW
jgi:hypothetical protein